MYEGIGAGLRRMLNEGVGVDGAAKPAGLDAGEVRRLTKPPAAPWMLQRSPDLAFVVPSSLMMLGLSARRR